jgi:uncharacterized Zn finger protein
VTRPPFSEYGPPLPVQGGLKAQTTRGAIGATWWSRRFIAVLESFPIAPRLARGRAYARKGQVRTLAVGPGLVVASVQGSRPDPYDVSIALAPIPEATWTRIEAVLATQALFSARLLAGEMPAEIEGVFAEAGAPLFPTTPDQLRMECSCPDWSVPCKHVAATFYLLAESFDADPFQILHWRGRDRASLLAHLRTLRDASPGARPTRRPARRGRRSAAPPATPASIGASAVLESVPSPDLAGAVDRFWLPPVPLPSRPTTVDAGSDLLLRQLGPPPAEIGGAELRDALQACYDALGRVPA